MVENASPQACEFSQISKCFWQRNFQEVGIFGAFSAQFSSYPPNTYLQMSSTEV